MASLIGNIVIVIFIIMAIQSITKNNPSIKREIETVISKIDKKILDKERETMIKRKTNHGLICSKREIILIASIVSDKSARKARKKFKISENQAIALSRKLLKEVQVRN